MNDGLQLLARYARDHAEDAFDEIVRRHVDLVYSAALGRFVTTGSPSQLNDFNRSKKSDFDFGGDLQVDAGDG